MSIVALYKTVDYKRLYAVSQKTISAQLNCSINHRLILWLLKKHKRALADVGGHNLERNSHTGDENHSFTVLPLRRNGSDDDCQKQ